MAEPFRLARVLRLREQIRRLRAHEAEQLAAHLAAVRAAAARVATERERAALEEGRAAMARTLTPEQLLVGRRYDAALAASERAYGDEIARTKAALDAKRAELLHDRQEEEKYSRLADAHRLRQQQEALRDAERALDEIAIDRHRRNRREQGDGRR